MWVANRAFISIINDLIFILKCHGALTCESHFFLQKILVYDQIKDYNRVSRSFKLHIGINLSFAQLSIKVYYTFFQICKMFASFCVHIEFFGIQQFQYEINYKSKILRVFLFIIYLRRESYLILCHVVIESKFAKIAIKESLN